MFNRMKKNIKALQDKIDLLVEYIKRNHKDIERLEAKVADMEISLNEVMEDFAEDETACCDCAEYENLEKFKKDASAELIRLRDENIKLSAENKLLNAGFCVYTTDDMFVRVSKVTDGKYASMVFDNSVPIGTAIKTVDDAIKVFKDSMPFEAK